MQRNIYIQHGQYNGRYGAGAIVFARRDEKPDVHKGEYYTIDEIIEDPPGGCPVSLRIILQGCQSNYSRKTFEVTEECRKRMSLVSR